MGFLRQRQILEGKSAKNLSDDMEGRKIRRHLSIKPSFPRHWQIIRHHLALTKKKCVILDCLATSQYYWQAIRSYPPLSREQEGTNPHLSKQISAYCKYPFQEVLPSTSSCQWGVHLDLTKILIHVYHPSSSQNSGRRV